VGLLKSSLGVIPASTMEVFRRQTFEGVWRIWALPTKTISAAALVRRRR